MSNDKMREEFEAWWRREHGSTLYCESAWRGWQASRAALAVELPFEFVNGTMRADQVIAAIEAAGVRVKP